MYHPTTRLLTILELLQVHPQMSGEELARRLEVDTRSVRRYILMLQEMGMPIASTPCVSPGSHAAGAVSRGTLCESRGV